MDITEQLTHESIIALAAAAEITRLRAEVEALKAKLAEYSRANDRIVAELRECDREVEALRADALKQVDCRQCKHATNRGCHSTALCERGELFEATPPWQFYDAARAAQGASDATN
jgi:multidrug resistance efflux pump